jgi:3-methylcrotonyl-CoA carboxylase alpha subunit
MIRRRRAGSRKAHACRHGRRGGAYRPAGAGRELPERGRPHHRGGASKTGAEAIHPGYGFLSENPDFVEAVEAAGLSLRRPVRQGDPRDGAEGRRQAADGGRRRAGGARLSRPEQEVVVLAAKAAEIGYPVLIKARAGGGGKGMRKVDEAGGVQGRAGDSAAGGEIGLRRRPACADRKIRRQPAPYRGAGVRRRHGNVVHLFERDCSLQRRHQKVIEEAPAPGMTDEVRAAMGRRGRSRRGDRLCGAGTVEFIADGSGRGCGTASGSWR